MPDWVLYMIPAFIFSMTLVVFIHELGHFLAARFFGVRIEAFSIGFGKAIGWGNKRAQFTDKYGTAWKIGWLPLGGYVKFWGDDGVASSTPDHEKLDHATAEQRASSFHFKPVYQRAIIAAAGPVANFILAFFVFSGMYLFAVDTKPYVSDVVKGMPAEKAGLKAGDVVESIDGTPIFAFRADLMQIVTLNEGRALKFVIRRGEQRLNFDITPVTFERKDAIGSKIQLPAIGITQIPPKDEAEFIRFGVTDALWHGYKDTYWFCAITLHFIGKLVTGGGDYEQLSGPIGIAKTSGQVFGALGWLGLVNLVAVLSVSIGLLNLFPIPMLDGGHLAFYSYEAVRGQPLTERVQEALALWLGMPLLLLLMLVATRNDIVRLFWVS